ncbi:acyl-CoA N-acyltransferase [Fimicolochytrium jonesii]|uniref:acyl-CoA N-acyltransferase n=1 Tax=Fimicolochytrium jonesii TaxID=1396493 RepID=UPI0022FE951E|nr:acyl-CoA N-acyltransferase [Fimicolochytrium jonesii]KAI8826551.1 acyl-CoA N-acyltransferase [Fimicolochytrium jonesii]
MTTLRRFVADDLFSFNNVNLDPLTETYNISFYLQYLAQWPDYFVAAEAPSGSCMGYVMGKAEGRGKLWHGHVTALTVAPEFRRLGLAQELMGILETVSDKIYNAFFVDLFVRVSNKVAIGMYEKFGYSVYRRVLEYYTGGGEPDDSTEDAFDMRKALPRDVRKESIVPLPHPVRPEDLEW